MRRRQAVLLAVAAVLAGALIATLALRSNDDDDARPKLSNAEALAKALQAVPADAPVLGLVTTDPKAPAVRSAAQLAQSFPAASIGLSLLPAQLLGDDAPDLAELRPLLTHPVVVAITPEGRIAATAVDDPDAAKDALDGSQAIVQDDVVLAASTPQALQRAAERAAAEPAPRDAATPASLARHLDGLDGQDDAIARFAIAPTALTPRLGALGTTRYARSVTQYGLAIAARPNALQLDLHARTPDTPPQQLPLAQGAQPPAPRGTGPLTLALRDAAQTASWLLAERANLGLQTIDDITDVLGRYASIDLDRDVLQRLTGTTTITSRDARTGTARADIGDPEALASTLDQLDRLDRLAGFADLLGVDTGGLELDEEDGVRTITKDDDPVARFLTADGALVVSTDPQQDLRQAAQAKPLGRLLPPKGALYATLDAPTARAQLVQRLELTGLARQATQALGPTLITARQEPTGLSATAIVALGTTP